MPALPAGQSVFPTPSSGMDSHGLPDDQPIFDQFSDLLTWDNIMYLVSNLGPGPQNTSHNPESKQDRPETLLTSLAQWSQNDTNTELLISLLLKNKKKNPFVLFS